MIEFAFVLIISTNPIIDEWEYQGNFSNCDVAHLWMTLHRPDARASKCMLQEYIYLPKDTIIKNIDMKNNTIRYRDTHAMCKFRRNCDG